MADTQSDSIQCLNFAKKWFIQYSIQYCFTQDSIQNNIQLKKNPADSIQKIIQFNSQGIIDTGWIGKLPKNYQKIAQKVSKIDKKGCFSSKMANIDLKYDSFIHFTIKFNSNDFSISFFQTYSIQKTIRLPFIPENSIQKFIQKFEFCFIEFNTIFIQLENQGIEYH